MAIFIYPYCSGCLLQESLVYPTKSTQAIETFQVLLIHVFSPFRFCKFIISDHGTAFENELLDHLCKATGIIHKYNLPRNKEKGSTGAVENKNKLCWSILRKYADQVTQDDWSDFCWTSAYAYNKSPHPDLADYSPDYLFHGLEPFTIIDLSQSSNELALKDDIFQQHRHRLEVAVQSANGQ